MSRAVPAHLAAIEDARLEQAGAAARTARRNQPKGLLVASGIVLLITLIYVITAFSSRRSAMQSLEESRDQAESALQMASELQALRSVAAANPREVGAASLLRTRVEAAGLEAGLSRPVSVPKTRNQPNTALGSVLYKFDYEVGDPSLSALLTWVEKSVAAVPGLEVYSLTIRPQPNSWSLKVTFSRWEKDQGS